MMKRGLSTSHLILIALLAVAVDQITKLIAQYTECNINLIAGFGLKYVINRGWAFGLFANTGLASHFGILVHTIAIVIVSLHYLNYRCRKDDLYILGVAFFIGGAVGAIIDRVFLGYGRDFLVIPSYATINFSDIFSTIGVVLILFTLIRSGWSGKARGGDG
ncbi:MAG TPA: signal peptidase II [bacterium (Candidatus Stahlbacteria)]|nr:signal peptidase II [Candidatus Stahlbacteria bacterium]